MARAMLSTFDNPFNPFEKFDSWLQFDLQKGHNSCELLGRIARTSDQLTDEENDVEIERAIDQIVKYDYEHKYCKIVPK